MFVNVQPYVEEEKQGIAPHSLWILCHFSWQYITTP
jgi:hypothetical protein